MPMSHLNTTTSRVLRTINALIWIGVWTATVVFTESYDQWLFVIIQGFVPMMLMALLHYALRPGGTDA